MATSTPTPPDADPPPSAQPRHETLDSVAAQIDAIDMLIGLARHSIRVFDVDLSGTRWNDAARAQKIVAFLRATPNARLDIVVHDTGWIERSCPRLTGLLKVRGHLITVRRTGEDARHAMDPLLIVDDQHYLHRLHAVADLELRDRLPGAAHLRALAGDDRQLLDRGVERLRVGLALADAHVERDLHDPRHLHDRRQAEVVLQLHAQLVVVALLHARNVCLGDCHQRSMSWPQPSRLQTRTLTCSPPLPSLNR